MPTVTATAVTTTITTNVTAVTSTATSTTNATGINSPYTTSSVTSDGGTSVGDSVAASVAGSEIALRRSSVAHDFGIRAVKSNIAGANKGTSDKITVLMEARYNGNMANKLKEEDSWRPPIMVC